MVDDEEDDDDDVVDVGADVGGAGGAAGALLVNPCRELIKEESGCGMWAGLNRDGLMLKLKGFDVEVSRLCPGRLIDDAYGRPAGFG